MANHECQNMLVSGNLQFLGIFDKNICFCNGTKPTSVYLSDPFFVKKSPCKESRIL